MFSWISDIYKAVIPDENSDPAHVYKWRQYIGNLVFAVTIVCFIIIIALTRGLPRVGAVAWAADVQTEVQKALQPVDKRVANIEATLVASTNASKSMLARLASDQIMALVRRRCKSRDAEEREYLTNEISRYGDEYEENRGRRYNVPSCDDIQSRESK